MIGARVTTHKEHDGAVDFFKLVRASLDSQSLQLQSEIGESLRRIFEIFPFLRDSRPETGFDRHCVAELAVQLAKFCAWPPANWLYRARTAAPIRQFLVGQRQPKGQLTARISHPAVEHQSGGALGVPSIRRLRQSPQLCSAVSPSSDRSRGAKRVGRRAPREPRCWHQQCPRTVHTGTNYSQRAHP
jgi:hypothetical protein